MSGSRSVDARFTDLVCALSSRLASASGERIHEEVRAALEGIRAFFGVDQCSIFRFVPDRNAVVLVHRAAIAGVPPIPANVDYGAAFPSVYQSVVVNRQPYVLDRVDDLPPDDAIQRGSCTAMGLGSFIALPIAASGVGRYSLGLGCHEREYRWPRERIRHMQALGEIIAGAIEREEDEDRVRRSESELAQAQGVARIGSWTRDFVADHFSVSEEACRIIGARPLTFAQWQASVHPDDRQAFADDVRETLAARRSVYRLEYRVVHPGGEVRAIVDEGEIHYAYGHPSRAIGTIRDVTQSRRLERELAELRSRLWHADRAARAGAMGGAIAHDLGQPLAAMLANAQAGLRFLETGRAEPDEMRGILQAIVRDDKRAIAIIEGIRSLLRRESVPKGPVDLSEALAEIVALVRREAESLGIEVATRLAPGLAALAAKAQVQQVGLNLLTNAIEAVRDKPPGERRIELAARRRGERIEVSVADTGRGIPPERREHIFEPFRSTRSGGLGLGLAITRSIVEAHDGRIDVEDNAGGGTTFRIEFPAIVPSDGGQSVEPDALPIDSQAPARTPAAGPLVCLVDDDSGVREAIARLLSSSGYAVAAFASGDALLASDEITRAACAVLDVRMKGLTGPEVHARLARRHPWLPVIFLTAHGDLPTGLEALKSGAVDFLLKPSEDVVLLEAIGRAVARGRDERAKEEARRDASERLARLTPREREILAHVARGRLNKQIANDLGIAEATVKQHRGRVMVKVGMRSVADLVRLQELAVAIPPTKVG